MNKNIIAIAMSAAFLGTATTARAGTLFQVVSRISRSTTVSVSVATPPPPPPPVVYAPPPPPPPAPVVVHTPPPPPPVVYAPPPPPVVVHAPPPTPPHRHVHHPAVCAPKAPEHGYRHVAQHPKGPIPHGKAPARHAPHERNRRG